jgi:hypothetical protein
MIVSSSAASARRIGVGDGRKGTVAGEPREAVVCEGADKRDRVGDFGLDEVTVGSAWRCSLDAAFGVVERGEDRFELVGPKTLEGSAVVAVR